MEPITLRLPTDLLETLEMEADDAGFSSRSEYIRHLLFNRPDLNQLTTTERSTAEPETKRIEEIDQSVDELVEQINTLSQRVTELENGESYTKEGDSSSVNSEPKSSSTDNESTTQTQSDDEYQSTEAEEDLDEFEQWLENEGPNSENARAVLLEAALILDDQGPLSANELRKQLYNRHPEAYGSAEALWASTVERLYDELPGFGRPAYGIYAFERDAVSTVTEESPK